MKLNPKNYFERKKKTQLKWKTQKKTFKHVLFFLYRFMMAAQVLPHWWSIPAESTRTWSLSHPEIRCTSNSNPTTDLFTRDLKLLTFHFYKKIAAWGWFHKLVQALSWTICALCPTVEKLFCGLKVRCRRQKISIGSRTVYEIDPCWGTSINDVAQVGGHRGLAYSYPRKHSYEKNDESNNSQKHVR